MLTVAEADVARLPTGLEADPGSLWWRRLLFSAEQALLLVRVAADSGARRGNSPCSVTATSTGGC